jgi:DNA-directed RNA polymerase subunit RPC12/RpoP
MTDIFDTTILCKKCGEEMEQTIVSKSGFDLRAIECPKCKDKIIHPEDKLHLEQYNNLKGKTYQVKLRMVGNSHAISIPKEIVSFFQQQEKIMDDMVRLCFEDMRNLRIQFFNDQENWHEKERLRRNI